MTRNYVVTGAASGIGLATAETLIGQGHRVVGVDLKNADVLADLSDPQNRRDAAKEAAQMLEGEVNAVIACAGIAAPIAKTFAINYFGVTEFLDAIYPALAASADPRVAVVSSIASLQPVSRDLVEAGLAGDEKKALELGSALEAQGQETGYLNYSSSKRAISRWLRRESITAKWAGAAIPMNAVAPGVVLTPMTEELLATPESAARVDSVTPMPLNYHQPAQTVADLLVWLTSEANSHMAGQTVYCDGGVDATLRGDDIWSWNDPE